MSTTDVINNQNVDDETAITKILPTSAVYTSDTTSDMPVVLNALHVLKPAVNVLSWEWVTILRLISWMI
ncbi:hypothetical protein [Lactovum miscens]|uniref:hypothetical protein n=1 Tax=Lactovum miscens TaxID=190387 RepID=UPI002EDA987C